MLKIYQLLSSKYEQQTENTLEGALFTAQDLANTYQETIIVNVCEPTADGKIAWRHYCDVKPINR